MILSLLSLSVLAEDELLGGLAAHEDLEARLGRRAQSYNNTSNINIVISIIIIIIIITIVKINNINNI